MKRVFSGHRLRKLSRAWAPLALALAVLATFLPVATAWSQTSGGTGFEIIGRIQSLTLNNPADVLSGGTVVVNNITVVIPRNTIITMPGTFLSLGELFNGATQSGLATSDSLPPQTPYEITVIGNIVNGTYIAGLVQIAQSFGQALAGTITAIDYATGDLWVSGTTGRPMRWRIQLNDPVGRFGRMISADARFTADTDNPTIHAQTGYPMCVPRTNPATQDDPECPKGNRPLDPVTGAPLKKFTMAAPGTPGALTNPMKQAPLMVGDFITYSGIQGTDARGAYLSVSHINAWVGISTAPGTLPAYVTQEVSQIGVGSGPVFPGIAADFKLGILIEGVTTDPTRPVDVYAVDVDACSGRETLRLLGTGFPAPIPQRYKFEPVVGNFLPVMREILVKMRQGTMPAANGLIAGQYRAPLGTYLLPGTLSPGLPLIPNNFGDFPFLAKGSGPFHGAGPVVGQLSPWPGAPAPAPSSCQ